MSPIPAIAVYVLHHDPLARACIVASLRGHPALDLRGEGDDLGIFEGGVMSADSSSVVVADQANALAVARTPRPTTGARSFRPGIVIVSGCDREWDLREALTHHVRGYLVAGFPLEQLAECVRAVQRGNRFLCARAAARLAESFAFEPLTDREREVLSLVIEGLCNKSIGRRLDISNGTVKSHLKSTYSKLNVVSRTQAIAAAERRGLLEPLQVEDLSEANESPTAHAVSDRLRVPPSPMTLVVPPSAIVRAPHLSLQY